MLYDQYGNLIRPKPMHNHKPPGYGNPELPIAGCPRCEMDKSKTQKKDT